MSRPGYNPHSASKTREKKMFGKKKPMIVEKPKKLSKEQQLGPRPDDIPNTEPLLTFQAVLRHSLPSVQVQAHMHDFGDQNDKSGRFTHFYVKDAETWVACEKFVCTDRTAGDGFYGWEWVKTNKTRSVFAIRTDDIIMVAAVDNTGPVENETLALEHRETPQPQGTSMYAAGGPVNPTHPYIEVPRGMDF